MPLDQTVQNAVVLGHAINPSILSQIWLVNQRLIAAEDFREGCIFSPHFSQVNAEGYQLLALPDRIQLAPNIGRPDAGDITTSVLGRIVTLLPHTPYTAAGLNFSWQIGYGDKDFADICRRLLCANNSISGDFSAPDARFGAYYTKDLPWARLKLDIKPITHDGGHPTLALNFNFSTEQLGEDAPAAINKLLTNWNSSRDLALDMSNRIASVQ